MKARHFMIAGMSGILLFGLTACGGGGSGGSDSGGNSKQKSTSGSITSFGSIYVNGVRYDTSNASITIEDKAATESDLRVGMMVHVIEDGNGGAATVENDNELEGLVNTNNIMSGQSTGTMDIMGQIVTVDINTIFESSVSSITSIDQVVMNNIIEVDGYSTGVGTITATRVEVKAINLSSYLISHPEGIEVKGVVANNNAGAQTFDFGNLSINYAGAILDNLSSISDGVYVEVKSVQGMNASNELIASRIELEDNGSPSHDGDEDDEYEVSGLVVAFSSSSVTVNGQTFQLDVQTSYDNGVQSDIQVAVMVEVEGKYNAAGVLVAEKVEFKSTSASNKLSGTVASVVSPNNNNDGTVTLNSGTIILVTSSTIMHDDRDIGQVPNKFFNLSDLQTGDYIKVYASDNGDGTYTALKLERDDPSSP